MTTAIPITRSEDHGTITFRGPHLAINITQMPPESFRQGWHSVLDDDPDGKGVTTRLHAYGRERLEEIRQLVEAALHEMETQEPQR
jgi:hypothetical protein